MPDLIAELDALYEGVKPSSDWHWDSDPIKGDPLERRRYRITTLGRTITQMYYSSGDPFAEAETKLIVALVNAWPLLREMAQDAARYRHRAEIFEGKRGVWGEASEFDFITDEQIDKEIAALAKEKP